MIDFELNIIDWNAISAIATTLAFVIAFCGIFISNKNEKRAREFQINLLKKECEQKNLDEFLAKVLEIFNAINPIDILNYSSKFINNTFTEQDRAAVEQNALNDGINCVKLNVLMIKKGNVEAAKILIKELGDVREIYGHWARNINSISAALDKCDEPESLKILTTAINDMANIAIKYDERVSSLLQSEYKTKSNLKELCMGILEPYESLTSIELQKIKKKFEKHLYEYVRIEQERINAMIL